MAAWPSARCPTLPGCAYIRDDVPVAAPLPKSAKAEIDGDLVYFNWADYLDPSIFKGFQKEYGVKIIQSNFDSMEGMYAKIAAGNQYDIVFPIAKWVVKMRREGKLRAIDPDQLTNAEQVFYPGSYFNDPWYDPKSRVSVPFTVYKTGIGWRTDKVSGMTGSWRDLWNPEGAGHIFTLDDQDEALAMAALLLGYDVNTAKTSHLEEMKKLLISQKTVPARLLLRRRQQHERRRRLDPPHVERRLPVPARGPGREQGELQLRGAQGGHADQLRRLRDPDQRPASRDRDVVHRLPAPAREREEEHQLPLLPVAGARRGLGRSPTWPRRSRRATST